MNIVYVPHPAGLPDSGEVVWTRGRPSGVRLNRFLVIDPASIRGEGAVLDRARSEAMATASASYLP